MAYPALKSIQGGVSGPAAGMPFGGFLQVGGATDIADGGLFYIEKTLTAAQVLLLATTAIDIVPAPGAGYVAVPVAGWLFLNYGGTAYTESGDNLALIWGAHGATQCSTTIEMTSFITLTVDAMTSITPLVNAIAAATVSSNLPIALSNLGSNFGNAGNSPLTVGLLYMLRATGF